MVKTGASRPLPTQPQRLDLLVIAATAVSFALLARFSGGPADWPDAHPRRGSSGSAALALGRVLDMARPLGADPSPWLCVGAIGASVAWLVGCPDRRSPAAQASTR